MECLQGMKSGLLLIAPVQRPRTGLATKPTSWLVACRERRKAYIAQRCDDDLPVKKGVIMKTSFSLEVECPGFRKLCYNNRCLLGHMFVKTRPSQ
jgi:hypothetical protein